MIKFFKTAPVMAAIITAAGTASAQAVEARAGVTFTRITEDTALLADGGFAAGLDFESPLGSGWSAVAGAWYLSSGASCKTVEKEGDLRRIRMRRYAVQSLRLPLSMRYSYKMLRAQAGVWGEYGLSAFEARTIGLSEGHTMGRTLEWDVAKEYGLFPDRFRRASVGASLGASAVFERVIFGVDAQFMAGGNGPAKRWITYVATLGYRWE